MLMLTIIWRFIDGHLWVFIYKKTLHCTNDVTYHVTSPLQCNGLFKNKSLYEIYFRSRSTSLQYTATPLFHCTVLTELWWVQFNHCTVLSTRHCSHYTALTTLHCIVLTTPHCTHYPALYSLYCTVLTTLHHHYYSALTTQHCTHYTALYSLNCIHCTALITLYSLHCTHYTVLYLLHWTVLTTLHHHYSTAQ